MREIRKWLRLIEANQADVTIVRLGNYKSKASALDYEGADFDNLAIMQNGNRIGEVSVQRGRNSITIRNIILYDASQTGKGLGRTIYAMLHDLYPGKILRSSFSTNMSNGQTTTGLSDQAIHMWDSLVARGQAKKITSGERFYYVLM